MKSVMNHEFSRAPSVGFPRSSFDRSHGYKTTFDAGYLIPILADRVIPGDTFVLDMNLFARLATPLKPIMDNMFLETFAFFVPDRLIWDNFQRFMGERPDPDSSTDFLQPVMTGPNVAAGGIEIGSLSDYFGLPTGPLSGGGGTTGLTFVSMFHRAYNLIYNEWFRDQNMQDSVVVDKDDGPDTYTDYVLRRRGKRHDYFTSSLPFAQKGAAVQLPLGSSAPVISDGNNITVTGGGGSNIGVTAMNDSDVSDGYLGRIGLWGSPGNGVRFGDTTGLVADLSDAVSASVNLMREAISLQQFLELDARGGTRYTEIVRMHFRVVSPDARLQRPEYLGGGRSYVNINPVAQTTPTPETPTNLDAQGNLAAFGTVSASGHGFTKSFTEHGRLIILACVRADLTYQQGVDRMFSVRTREEEYWPTFANLGEQAVLNREIFANVPDGTAANQKDGVFGYQEPYADYRYKPSKITGQFRSTSPTPLDMWHLSQEFESLPTLDPTFIVENPPLDRAIAVQSEPHFMMDVFFKYRCTRPMPVYSIPGLTRL